MVVLSLSLWLLGKDMQSHSRCEKKSSGGFRESLQAPEKKKKKEKGEWQETDLS